MGFGTYLANLTRYEYVYINHPSEGYIRLIKTLSKQWDMENDEIVEYDSDNIDEAEDFWDTERWCPKASWTAIPFP